MCFSVCFELTLTTIKNTRNTPKMDNTAKYGSLFVTGLNKHVSLFVTLYPSQFWLKKFVSHNSDLFPPHNSHMWPWSTKPVIMGKQRDLNKQDFHCYDRRIYGYKAIWQSGIWRLKKKERRETLTKKKPLKLSKRSS